MTFQLPCRVHFVGATRTTPKGWRYRELVVEDDDPRYPQQIPVQFSGERVALLDCIRKGDYVRVTFDLAGRQWEDRYYATVRGWTIDVRGGDGVYRRVEPRRDDQPGLFDNATASAAPGTPQGAATAAGDDLDTLPF